MEWCVAFGTHNAETSQHSDHKGRSWGNCTEILQVVLGAAGQAKELCCSNNVVACCSLARVVKCVGCISDHAIQHWKLTPNAAAWFLLTWLSQIYHIFLQNCFVIHSTLYSASLMIYVPCDDTLLEMNCAKGKNGHGTFSAEWSSITLLLHTGAAQMTK